MSAVRCLMKCVRRIAAVAPCLLISAGLHAQDLKAVAAFDDLLTANHFIQNYQEQSAAMARVFGARAQGSDREFAAFSAKVAAADLTHYRGCMSKAYAAGPLTEADAIELARMFRTPAEEHLNAITERSAIANIEAGSNRGTDLSLLSDSDRRQVAVDRNSPLYARYVAFLVGQEHARFREVCLKELAISLGFGP